MQIDRVRIEQYLSDMAAELIDMESILTNTDDDILQDRHLIKSLKYSVVVISETMGSAIQHILARKHNTAVDGYGDAFVKALKHKLLPSDLLERLKPFFRFRNMLVHQYWRVDDQLFLKNLRGGLRDFRGFIKEIKTTHLNEL